MAAARRVPRGNSVSTRLASSDAVLALSAFYGVGGLLCFVSLVVPAWSGRDVAVIAAVGVTAAVVASALPAGRGRLSRRVCYVLVLLGSALIAALVYAGMGGGASVAYAGFYVWVAVYSFLFFSPRSAIVQVIVALLCQAVALLAVGEGETAPAQIALSAGTILATGAVVGLLAARLRALTLTDDLTGLPNRRALDAVLHDRLIRDRHRPPIAVLGIDLDGFKRLNDARGHAAGDALLREVAARWSAELRKGDFLARNGGDEFIAVLADCDAAWAQAVATRLVAVVPSPVSACVGVVVVPESTDASAIDLQRVLADVDASLYKGKSRGAGSVVVFAQPLAADRPSIPSARGNPSPGPSAPQSETIGR